MSKPSPCIGYCQIDEASGFCAGCARSRSEVAAWRQASPAWQERIWAELPRRRAKLGIGLHQLGWTHTEIRSFVVDSLRFRRGTWVVGVYGAVAEFCIGADEPVDFDFHEEHIAAATDRAAIRFEIADRVRALSLATKQGDAAREVVLLATPRARVERPAPLGVRPLGPDRASIGERNRSEALFDLGLGIGEIEFCVRTADPEFADGLSGRVGQKLPELLAGFGRRILQASPTRVAVSPIGRLEVFAPIPPPGGRSPDGPHTHLLPAHLALERETPPGLELPPAHVACAIFYPETGPADSCV